MSNAQCAARIATLESALRQIREHEESRPANAQNVFTLFVVDEALEASQRVAPRRTVANVRDAIESRGLVDLANECARKYHVPLEAMLGTGRHPTLLLARNAFWLALRGLALSHAEIASLFGVHRTTVLNALRRFEPSGGTTP